MDIRSGLVLMMVVVAGQASAQQIHSARGPAPKVVMPAPKAAHNAMSKTTTPFNCEQYRWPHHPHPGMKTYCEQLEASTLQGEAQRVGRPGPSADVIALPALGSEAARRSGRACVGGQAMRRLSNGWEQLSSGEGGWQRCREG